MKKRIILFIALILLILMSSASAKEADDISMQCTYVTSSSKRSFKMLFDKKYTNYWESVSNYESKVEVTAPSGIPIYGTYVCFGRVPDEWRIEVFENEEWKEVFKGEKAFLHQYIPLNGVEKYRIVSNGFGKNCLRINELFSFSRGNLPNWVQIWDDTHSKADIMFLVAHPDDEILFMGGAIPTYASEYNRNVVVAYMTTSNTTRSSELLNGLWEMGLKNYPVLGDFRDVYMKNLNDAYVKWGKGLAREFVIELFRKYKPEVVVTHDINGEYGHGAHELVADVAIYAYDKAAKKGEIPESFYEHGSWQVKKLYLHLFDENIIKFNWQNKISSLGNKTGEEIARKAYSYHETQQNNKFKFDDLINDYDYESFGLIKSEVGVDLIKNDFLEHIYEPNSFVKLTPSPKPTLAPTPVPDYIKNLPQLNEKGFIDNGEYIYENDEEGNWIYISDSLKVIINKKYDANAPLTWYEAEIFSDPENGEIFRAIPFDHNNIGGLLVDPSTIAKKQRVVFAINSDYFSYRRGGHRPTGIDIRNSDYIIYDNQYKEPTYRFPNLDMLALYQDGRMEVYGSTEKTVEDFMNLNALDVLSFGPYLIRDGVINEELYKVRLWDMLNPRCAIGMIEPGKYVAIMAEGRLKNSKGINLDLLTRLLYEKDCKTAFNLDGGQTAVMIFMGKQINEIGVYDGKINPRKTSEILGIGKSDKVLEYDVTKE